MRRRLIGLAMFVVIVLTLTSQFVVRDGHPALHRQGPRLLWKEEPFTGLIFRLHPNYRPEFLATYYSGARHGWEISWFVDGTKSRQRAYQGGLYHGVSQTWHANGRISTWRTYDHGLADGEQWAWGRDGQVLEYNRYQKDQELVHRTWTFDGKPFHNYVFQNGDKVGVQGEQFCKRIKRY